MQKNLNSPVNFPNQNFWKLFPVKCNFKTSYLISALISLGEKFGKRVSLIAPEIILEISSTFFLTSVGESISIGKELNSSLIFLFEMFFANDEA